MGFEPDMRAVSRVASRVQLADIHLIDLILSKLGESGESSLEACIKRDCTARLGKPQMIEVTCRFDFSGKDAAREIVRISAKYVLFYRLDGMEPVVESDLEHFGFANGAYNSWPFARELLYSLTSRMGLPPFVLPVLTFAPPRPTAHALTRQPASPGHVSGRQLR